mmetsp:Transcript_12299/g.33807  ORF Transcript_12299/g.33807 Transcript_12299/m.33807 type:complete len:254 (-) Transcript_12299:131-892(-)
MPMLLLNSMEINSIQFSYRDSDHRDWHGPSVAGFVCCNRNPTQRLPPPAARTARPRECWSNDRRCHPTTGPSGCTDGSPSSTGRIRTACGNRDGAGTRMRAWRCTATSPPSAWRSCGNRPTTAGRCRYRSSDAPPPSSLRWSASVASIQCGWRRRAVPAGRCWCSGRRCPRRTRIAAERGSGRGARPAAGSRICRRVCVGCLQEASQDLFHLSFRLSFHLRLWMGRSSKLMSRLRQLHHLPRQSCHSHWHCAC